VAVSVNLGHEGGLARDLWRVTDSHALHGLLERYLQCTDGQNAISRSWQNPEATTN